MAFNITYWTNFSKRINSTKQPTGGTNISVVLKMPCSVEKPIFVLTGISESINYIKWDSRYYYVTDVTWQTNTIKEVSCDIDLLATYKSNITSTKAFIEYTQYGFNADILDPRISNTANILSSSSTLSGLNGYISAAGTYILSVIGTDGTAVRYAMTRSGLNDLGDKISTAPSSAIDDAFVKKYGSCLECIRGCTWVPFIYAMPNNDEVLLGSYNTHVPATIIPDLSSYGSVGYMSVPWINAEKCRKDNETITLFLPGYGVTILQPSAIHYESSLNIRISYDITGNLIYILHSGGHDSYYQCNLGVEIPITQYVQSPTGMVVGAMSNEFTSNSKWAATRYSGNTLNDRIGNAIEGTFLGYVGNILGRLVNTGCTVGSIGGQGGAAMADFVSMNNDIVMVNRTYDYSEAQADMADRYGRPYFAVNTISNMLVNNTGYVQTNGASVDIPGYEEEKNKVCAFLNGGVFIE